VIVLQCFGHVGKQAKQSEKNSNKSKTSNVKKEYNGQRAMRNGNRTRKRCQSRDFYPS